MHQNPLIFHSRSETLWENQEEKQTNGQEMWGLVPTKIPLQGRVLLRVPLGSFPHYYYGNPRI